MKKAVSGGTIAITSADKGGTVIIKEITAFKIGDMSREEPLDGDPTPDLRKQLILHLWSSGFVSGFVNTGQAKAVVGSIPKSDGTTAQSTSDEIKPGISYGYLLLKTHKLTPDQLQQKKVLPCRIVTDLSKGATAKSDTFIS